MKYNVLCSLLISFWFLFVGNQTEALVGQKSERGISFKDLYIDKSGKFHGIFAEKDNFLDLKMALNIIKQRVFSVGEDQQIDVYKVFDELRSEYTEDSWSNEDIMRFIDDALEIKKKYPIFLNFVIRSKYAKKAVAEGIDEDEILALASSEYIHLPKFILRDFIKDKDLNRVLGDLGIGVIWKDRMKYLYISIKYGDNERQAVINKLDNCPRYVDQYFQLINEISKYFEDADNHIGYIIAQDFFFDNLPKEKIMKIFSFSEKEWKSLIKPKSEY